MNKMITAAALAALCAACSAAVPENIEESGKEIAVSFTAALPGSKDSFGRCHKHILGRAEQGIHH